MISRFVQDVYKIVYGVSILTHKNIHIELYKIKLTCIISSSFLEKIIIQRSS